MLSIIASQPAIRPCTSPAAASNDSSVGPARHRSFQESGMKPPETDPEAEYYVGATNQELAESSQSGAVAGSNVFQGIQVPVPLHQSHSSFIGGGIQYYPMSLPALYWPPSIQPQMFYPFQQQQLSTGLGWSSPNPGLPALGVLPASNLSYNHTMALQQNLLGNNSFFPPHLVQQNQAHITTGAGHHSALPNLADDSPAPVMETEASVSRLTSSASTAETSGSDIIRETEQQKPKRPLSAYNIFFKEERAKLVVEPVGEALTEPLSESSSDRGRGRKRPRPHRRIGFEEMAKTIGPKWHALVPQEKARYKALAAEEKKKYEAAMAAYTIRQRESIEKCREQLEATVSETTRQRYLASSGSRTNHRKRKNSGK